MTENEKRARIFKSFCDANRLTILGLLKGGEKCACELLDELHIGQPTHYSFDPQGVQKAKELLDEITEFSPGCSDNCSCKQ